MPNDNMRLSGYKIFIINIMQAIAQPSLAALNGNFGLNRYKNCLRADCSLRHPRRICHYLFAAFDCILSRLAVINQ
jgi:hypothetical protein